MGPLNVPYSLFLWGLMLKTSPNYSCSHSHDSNHAHSLMSSQQARLSANECPCRPGKVLLSEMDKARRLFSKLIHAKEDRNAQPSASQGLSTAKPRSSHPVCTHWAHSPCPILSAGAEPLSPRKLQEVIYHEHKIC